jgi:hypothetical protein
MKKCSKCSMDKPLSDFQIVRKKENGDLLYKSQCKECYNKHYISKYHNMTQEQKRKRRKHITPERRKNYKLRNTFGITLDDFNKMLQEQNNACFICTQDITHTAMVDHCHKTGTVRKLLCRHCNTGIGFLKENITILENCIKYLRIHANTP